MIFYFSGTGNSLEAARTIASITHDQLVDIGAAFKEGRFDFVAEQGTNLGFVFPTYCWSTPRIIDDFLANLIIMGPNGRPFVPGFSFVVITCGGFVGDTARFFEKMLWKNQGIRLDSSFSIQNVDNCIFLMGPGSPDKQKQLQRQAHQAARQIGYLIDGKRITRQEKRNAFGSLMSKLTCREGKNLSTSKFMVDADACIHCGQCEQLCPTGSIQLVDAMYKPGNEPAEEELAEPARAPKEPEAEAVDEIASEPETEVEVEAAIEASETKLEDGEETLDETESEDKGAEAETEDEAEAEIEVDAEDQIEAERDTDPEALLEEQPEAAAVDDPEEPIETHFIPVWAIDGCTWCMACIQRCPAEAIQFGKSTKNRPRYTHPILAERPTYHSAVAVKNVDMSVPEPEPVDLSNWRESLPTVEPKPAKEEVWVDLIIEPESIIGPMPAPKPAPAPASEPDPVPASVSDSDLAPAPDTDPAPAATPASDSKLAPATATTPTPASALEPEEE